MPAALKLQESLGDDLAVIFVECQGATRDEVESFAIARRWMGGRALWTTERPFDVGSRSLPYFVLLGSDGRVIGKGDPLAAHKEIERCVTEEIGQRGRVSGEATAGVRAARGEYRRGRADRALAELRDLAQSASAGERVGGEARAALAELSARLERDAARAQWLLDRGYFEEAQTRVAALRGTLRGDAQWTRRLDELAARLDAPELVAEREAARLIGRAMAEFFHSGGDPTSASELVRVAEAHPSARAAAEARRLVALARRR